MGHPGLWKRGDFRRDAMRRQGGGAANVVNHIGNFTFVVEGYGDHVVKTHAGALGNFDGAGKNHLGVAEHAVDSQAPGLVMGDFIGDLVRGPPVHAGRTRKAGLVGRIVRNLGLIEVGAAVLAVPKDLKLLVMLNEQAVGGDVVAVDHQAIGAHVGVPSHSGAAVSTPDPGMVDDGVAA